MDLRTQEIYRDSKVAIEIDERLRYIYVEWQQHIKGDDFRKLFSDAAAIALDRKCHYWLSDARAIHFVEFADQNWMLREMTPLLLKSELIKFARISNKESMSLLDIQRVYSELNNLGPQRPATELEVFLTKEDALLWLFGDL